MEEQEPIRVLLADDHEMVRQLLRGILQTYSDVEVVGEASDGEEALVSASTLKPRVIVMDLAMPRMDGITATRLIKEHHPQIAVLGLSIEPKHYELYAIQRAGACGFVRKDRAVHDLYEAIQRAVIHAGNDSCIARIDKHD